MVKALRASGLARLAAYLESPAVLNFQLLQVVNFHFPVRNCGHQTEEEMKEVRAHGPGG